MPGPRRDLILRVVGTASVQDDDAGPVLIRRVPLIVSGDGARRDEVINRNTERIQQPLGIIQRQFLDPLKRVEKIVFGSGHDMRLGVEHLIVHGSQQRGVAALWLPGLELLLLFLGEEIEDVVITTVQLLCGQGR